MNFHSFPRIIFYNFVQIAENLQPYRFIYQPSPAILYATVIKCIVRIHKPQRRCYDFTLNNSLKYVF